MRCIAIAIAFGTCAIISAGCGDDVTVIQGGLPSGTTTVMFASPDTGVFANGTTASTITITVRSASNVPVHGQVVELSATGSGNVLVQPSITTDANGVATGTISSTTAETKTITAMINPGPSQVIVSQTTSVVFASGPGPVSDLRSTVSANPSAGIVADGTQVATVTITVLDAIDNPVPGQTVQLMATGPGNTITQPSSPTDANGSGAGIPILGARPRLKKW